MDYRKNLPQNSKRLAKTMLKALSEHDWSKQSSIMLGCYDNMLWDQISVAVTTRIDACNHYYIMQVYEISTQTESNDLSVHHKPLP